ncbi:MAG: hypothetical protein ABI679_12545 [Gemmatimonadota bacterium]
MRMSTCTEYSRIISIHLAGRNQAGDGPTTTREIPEAEQQGDDLYSAITRADRMKQESGVGELSGAGRNAFRA